MAKLKIFGYPTAVLRQLSLPSPVGENIMNNLGKLPRLNADDFSLISPCVILILRLQLPPPRPNYPRTFFLVGRAE